MSDTTPQSELQAQLIENGAHAQYVDADAMLAQMKAMQDQYDSQQKALIARIQQLEAERGVPADPIAGGKADLIAHIKARAAQYPTDDFSDVLAAAEALPDDDTLTANHTAYVHDVVSNAVAVRPRHEIGYIKELSGKLHSLVLKKAAGVA